MTKRTERFSVLFVFLYPFFGLLALAYGDNVAQYAGMSEIGGIVNVYFSYHIEFFYGYRAETPGSNIVQAGTF